MTRRKWMLALIIAVAVVTAGTIVIGGVVVIGRRIVQEAKTAPDQTPLTEADKRLFVTAPDIARLGGPAVEPEAENWSSLRQGNGSRFILYLYEPKGEESISIYSRLVLLPRPADAVRMYKMDKVMLKLQSGSESYVPAPGLSGGGERNAWFIEKDGEKIGTFFLIREGRFLQRVRLIGLTLHKPADVQNLLGRMLAELKRASEAEGSGSAASAGVGRSADAH